MVRRLLVTATLLAICGCSTAGEPIPTSLDSTFGVSMDIHFMTRGAPQDSLVLRVSLCFAEELRCGGHSSVVVEEWRWPPPEPGLVVDDDLDFTVVADEAEWLLGVSRIDGAWLNARSKLLPPAAMPGMRPGRLGEHFLYPFEFVAWSSPFEFVIADTRTRYVIARTGPHTFELVDMVRVERD